MLGRSDVVRVQAAALAAACLVLLAGCGTSTHGGSRGGTTPASGSGATAGGTSGVAAADRSFLQQMIPHHQRAIAVAQIARGSATDPRVRAFAARVVREQTPELAAMQRAAAGMSLDYSAGASTAMHRISDTQVTALRALKGPAFDREWVQLNITSERGAYAMARTELAGGTDPAARTVATGISHSPSEIAELTALLAALHPTRG